jgi:hypothetical protein
VFGSLGHCRYCNKSLSIAERVETIITRMTVAEKILMLDSGNPGVGRLGIRPMQVLTHSYGRVLITAAVASLGIAAPCRD